MTIEEIRENEIEYCRGDPAYFVETYCHIEDKDADELIQPFKLWPMQKQALMDIHTHRLNAILKARQLGFSWLAMSYAAYLLRCWTGRTAIGISRTEEEGKELARRLGVIFRHMPELIAEKGSVPEGWTGPVFEAQTLKVVITFPNGPDSTFMAFPSSPNAARSFTADLIIFDEWAFQQYAAEIWTSAFPVINRPFGGKVIGLSTIERGSLFEDIFTDPDNGFHKIFIPWYADPKRDQEWYENTKKTMGALITQEYPATIEEALTVPGGSYFPEWCKEHHEVQDLPTGPVLRYVFIDYGLDMFSAHWVMVDTDGNATIYREYDSPNKTIGEAADIMISMSEGEKIELFLAPPDLWNRSQESGKSRALLFSEAGVDLTKSNNDFEDGCAAMKEWTKPRADGKARLRLLEGCAPNLFRCMSKIQRDKRRPNVYAKDPHDLTHDPDGLRYFCIYWVNPPETSKANKKKKWTPDMYEDYENANAEDRKMLLKIWGEPERW